MIILKTVYNAVNNNGDSFYVSQLNHMIKSFELDRITGDFDLYWREIGDGDIYSDWENKLVNWVHYVD